MGAGGRPGVPARPAVADRALADEPDRVRPSARPRRRGWSRHASATTSSATSRAGASSSASRAGPGSTASTASRSRRSTRRARASRTRSTRDVELKLRPLYRVLIKAHDALVEDLLDNAERAVGGRPLPVAPAAPAGACRQRRRGRLHAGSRHEAPGHRAHLAALAHPRARARLPARGRVGAADAGRPGRPRAARRARSPPGTSRTRWTATGASSAMPTACARASAARCSRCAGGSARSSTGTTARAERRCATACPPTCSSHPGRTPRACPSRSLYLTHDEWAAEIVNRTVHAVMHIGWVPDDAGGYHGADGGAGQAERVLRPGLHGGDRARSGT